MKQGESAELSVKWWKSSQPKGLSTAARLEMALKAYEAARTKLIASKTSAAAKAALDVLENVAAAAKVVAAEAVKTKSPEMQATAAALGKWNMNKERDWADAQVADEAEADEEGGLADLEAYKLILRKSLQRLRAGEMNFAFVMGVKPEQHRLLFSKSKGGMNLATASAKLLHLNKFTFGIARQSDDRPDTILLTIEGRQMPGVVKKGQRMLALCKPQPMTKIALFVGGEEVEDIADPADLDDGALAAAAAALPAIEALKRTFETETPRVRAAIAAHPDQRGRLSAVMAEIVEALKSDDRATADRRLRMLRTEVDGLLSDGPAVAEGAIDYRKLLLDWQTSRSSADAKLKQLERVILAEFEGEPDFEEARIRIRKLDQIMLTLGAELQDKLDAAMNTPPADRRAASTEINAIAERYRAYVQTDPFVAAIDDNPFIPLNLRGELLDTLSGLSTAMAA